MHRKRQLILQVAGAVHQETALSDRSTGRTVVVVAPAPATAATSPSSAHIHPSKRRGLDQGFERSRRSMLQLLGFVSEKLKRTHGRTPPWMAPRGETTPDGFADKMNDKLNVP